MLSFLSEQLAKNRVQMMLKKSPGPNSEKDSTSWVVGSRFCRVKDTFILLKQWGYITTPNHLCTSRSELSTCNLFTIETVWQVWTRSWTRSVYKLVSRKTLRYSISLLSFFLLFFSHLVKPYWSWRFISNTCHAIFLHQFLMETFITLSASPWKITFCAPLFYSGTGWRCVI